MELLPLPASKKTTLESSSDPIATTTTPMVPPLTLLPPPLQPSLNPPGCPPKKKTIRRPPQDARVRIALLKPPTLPSFKRLTSTLLPIRYPDAFYTSLLGPEEKTLSFAYVALWNDTPSRASKKAESRTQSKGKRTRQVVGGISVRLEPVPPPDATSSSTQSNGNSNTKNGNSEIRAGPHALYISTLSVLSPYRRHAIGCNLIQAAITHALELVSSLNTPPILAQVPDPSLQSKDKSNSNSNTQRAGISLEYIYAHVWETNTEAAEWYGRRGFEVGEVEEGYYRRLKPGGARVVRRGITGALSALNEMGPSNRKSYDDWTAEWGLTRVSSSFQPFPYIMRRSFFGWRVRRWCRRVGFGNEGSEKERDDLSFIDDITECWMRYLPNWSGGIEVA